MLRVSEKVGGRCSFGEPDSHLRGAGVCGSEADLVDRVVGNSEADIKRHMSHIMG